MACVVHSLGITLMLALAWRAGGTSEDTRALRPGLATALGLALLLRLGIEALRRAPPGPAQAAAALATELVALAFFWPLSRLALAGPYKRGGRTTRAVLLGLAALLLCLGQSEPATVFLWFGLTRHPWLQALDTRERFRASLASLLVTLALLVGASDAHGL